jgi:hypothetical protein
MKFMQETTPPTFSLRLHLARDVGHHTFAQLPQRLSQQRMRPIFTQISTRSLLGRLHLVHRRTIWPPYSPNFRAHGHCRIDGL